MHLVRFEEGHIEFSLGRGRAAAPSPTISLACFSNGPASAGWWRSLRKPGAADAASSGAAAERERKEGAANHPLVQAVLVKFPGAQIVNVVDRSEKTADEAAILSEPDAARAPEFDGDDDLF